MKDNNLNIKKKGANDIFKFTKYIIQEKMKKQENLKDETELNEQENLEDATQETNSKKKVHLKGEKEEIIKKGEKTLSEFKKFIAKGNAMDLAVGVIIGSAFGKIVSSIVDDILMPLIGVIIGGIDFSNLSIKIGEATVTYGNFIQNVIDFLIIAVCIFFIVKIMKKFTKKEEEPAPDTVLLEEIRDLLKEKQEIK